MRHFGTWLLAAPVMLFALAGCGSSAASRGTGPVTIHLTPAGGAVRVVTKDLVEVTFTFPVGAVSAPLDVTVTPLPTAAGAWSTLQVAPAGTTFAKPVSVAVVLPSTITVTAHGQLYFGTPAAPEPLDTTVSVPQR